MSAGAHRLHVEARAALARDFDFAVEPRQTTLKLEPIQVQPRFRLGYTVVLGTPTSASGRISYDVTVWLDGAEHGDVEAVSYILPPPLQAEPVMGAPSSQTFCYRELGTATLDDLLVMGSESRATAKVDLDDGSSLAVVWNGDSLSQPGDCPTTQGRDPAEDNGETRRKKDTGGGGGTAQEVPVPEVTGMQRQGAISVLVGSGLAVGEITDVADDRPGGTVLSSAPEPGTRVARGTVVTLTVSSGPCQATVPDVLGRTFDDATEELLQNQLTATVGSYVEVTDAKPGTVLDQEPNADSSVACGTEVTITLASDVGPSSPSTGSS